MSLRKTASDIRSLKNGKYARLTYNPGYPGLFFYVFLPTITNKSLMIYLERYNEISRNNEFLQSI